MLSRVNFLETAPNRIDDVTRVVREVVHPAVSAERGYVGYLVLGNRETGDALGVTLWDSERDREISDARARQIRPIVEAETGGVMRAVEEYEVLFLDVRRDMLHGV
jgi:hypothetical protein